LSFQVGILAAFLSGQPASCPSLFCVLFFLGGGFPLSGLTTHGCFVAIFPSLHWFRLPILITFLVSHNASGFFKIASLKTAAHFGSVFLTKSSIPFILKDFLGLLQRDAFFLTAVPSLPTHFGTIFFFSPSIDQYLVNPLFVRRL